MHPAVHHSRHPRHPHRPLHVHVLHYPPQVRQPRPGHTQDRPVSVLRPDGFKAILPPRGPAQGIITDGVI